MATRRIVLFALVTVGCVGVTVGPAAAQIYPSHPVTIIVPVGTAFELLGNAVNLFDVQYADPASNSLRQDVIAQNGRTLRVGLRWKLWSK